MLTLFVPLQFCRAVKDICANGRRDVHQYTQISRAAVSDVKEELHL